MWIWEGDPISNCGDFCSLTGEYFSHCSYNQGSWRQPTPEEWAKIQAGEQLWPSMREPSWAALETKEAFLDIESDSDRESAFPIKVLYDGDSEPVIVTDPEEIRNGVPFKVVQVRVNKVDPDKFHDIEVLAPGCWDNDLSHNSLISTWWAVTDDRGIFAYAGSEDEADLLADSARKVRKEMTNKVTLQDIHEDMEAASEKTAAYLRSPEGQKALLKAKEEASALVELAREARKINPDDLRKPFDI